jgi:prevent-host-death family protein
MTISNQTSIGAYDAKTRFSELLERVAGGEEITITRHGSPVARLVPILSAPSADDRRDAIRQMQELASRNRLGGLSVKQLRAEGRK